MASHESADRRCARSNPKVAMVQEKIDACSFQLDGEGRALGLLHNLNFSARRFIAARRAFSAGIFPVTMTLDSCVNPFKRFERSGSPSAAQTLE